MNLQSQQIPSRDGKSHNPFSKKSDSPATKLPHTPATKPIRILVIDDHELFRALLRLLIEKHPNLMIFGEAANCAEALAAAREQPEIILLDIDLHGESGLDMISQLLTIAKEARVIILTAMCNPEVQERAAFLGAMGVVSKDQSPEVLIKAIEKVHAGEVWLERSTMAKVLGTISHAGEAKDQSPEAAKIGSLTEREREIVNLVGAGLKSKEIANRLFICEGTVSHHLTSIFDKLEIHHRLELMVYAYRNGLAKLFL